MPLGWVLKGTFSRCYVDESAFVALSLMNEKKLFKAEKAINVFGETCRLDGGSRYLYVTPKLRYS